MGCYCPPKKECSVCQEEREDEIWTGLQENWPHIKNQCRVLRGRGERPLEWEGGPTEVALPLSSEELSEASAPQTCSPKPLTN